MSYNKKLDLSLYLVTDSALAAAKQRTVEETVEEAIEGGATIIQLREKNATSRGFIELAQRVKQVTKKHNVPLLINDRVDVALAVDADGVHLGEDDMPIDIARKLLGQDKIIGVTVSKPDAAQAAEASGADYLGTDAIFPTSTKTDKTAIGLDQFKEIVNSTKLPIVAIGGINVDNTPTVLKAGAAGIAVVSAIMSADDVREASSVLSKLVKQVRGETNNVPLAVKAVDPLAIKLGSILEQVKKNRSLIHHITNFVVMNLTANATLAVGALPVMAHAQEEVEDMVSHAGALVLNMGTPDAALVVSAHKAGKKANELKIPVVLDPVGAGATAYRTKINTELIESLHLNVIKGNYGEISSIAGDKSAKVVGVESISGPANPEKLIYQYAAKLKNVVAMSGKTDLVSDGKKVLGIDNGHPLMSSVTGIGCVATTVVAIFASAESDHLLATAGALALVGIAGERAARQTQTPANFEIAFLAELYKITPSQLSAECRVRELPIPN